MAYIEISNLNLQIKKYVLLKDINYSFTKGKVYGLKGRNGSGKTLLMKCICGFMTPNHGDIIVDGKKIGPDVDFPKNTGIIIESPGFIPYYTAFQNLKLLADIRGNISKERIHKCLEIVGLDPNNKKSVNKYSLGMKQRLGIAQAIMEDPDLLILDEPFNGLDSDGVKEIQDYLLKLKEQGKTIILTSRSEERRVGKEC